MLWLTKRTDDDDVTKNKKKEEKEEPYSILIFIIIQVSSKKASTKLNSFSHQSTKRVRESRKMLTKNYKRNQENNERLSQSQLHRSLGHRDSYFFKLVKLHSLEFQMQTNVPRMKFTFSLFERERYKEKKRERSLVHPFDLFK